MCGYNKHQSWFRIDRLKTTSVLALVVVLSFLFIPFHSVLWRYVLFHSAHYCPKAVKLFAIHLHGCLTFLTQITNSYTHTGIERVFGESTNTPVLLTLNCFVWVFAQPVSVVFSCIDHSICWCIRSEFGMWMRKFIVPPWTINCVDLRICFVASHSKYNTYCISIYSNVAIQCLQIFGWLLALKRHSFRRLHTPDEMCFGCW